MDRGLLGTEVLDGGVDGVAAEEEELDEVGADEAAAAGDANGLLRLHLRRWCCRLRSRGSCVKGVAISEKLKLSTSHLLLSLDFLIYFL